MPPSSDNDDGTGRIKFSEGGMRPSITKLEMVPETREERATRFTLRAIIVTIAIIAAVVAIVSWRSWANAENRAEAVVAYDTDCSSQSAARAIELLEQHGETASELLAARIRMERAFEEFAEVPEEPFDVNGAPTGARADAAIAEAYRLLIRNERSAAAQMISAVRRTSPAALRARVRAASTLGQFKYAAEVLAAAPPTSDSAVRAELEHFVGAMTEGETSGAEGPHALTGALRASLAQGDRTSIAAFASKLEKLATTPRQKRWVHLGLAYEAAYTQGALADLTQLRGLQADRVPWSDVYTLALGEALLMAQASRASLRELTKLTASSHGWIGAIRLLRSRVLANLMLGDFGKAESEISKLGKAPLDHLLRGWSSMARGRTQAAQRHLSLVGREDPLYAPLGELMRVDIALTANDRDKAQKLLDSVAVDLPRWKAEAAVRRTLLEATKLVSRFAPSEKAPKPSSGNPFALVRYADTVAVDEAVVLYKQALERLPAMPHANLGLFEVDVRSGVPAKDWLKKMRFDNPHAPRAAQAQGLLWLRDGEGSRGAAKLGKLMTRYGMHDWPELLTLSARLYAQSGEYVRAVRQFARAANLAEDELDSWVQIMARKSIAHAELGAKGPAETVLEQIEKKVAEQGRDTLQTSTEALWTAARARQSLVDKKFVAAQLFAKRALKAEPGLVEAHMVLVDFAEEKNREDLDSLKAAADAPWPSYRAKRLLAKREKG